MTVGGNLRVSMFERGNEGRGEFIILFPTRMSELHILMDN